MQDQGSARACERCVIDRAVWRHPTTKEYLCALCGAYVTGHNDGEAGAAKEHLIDAIIALSGLGVAARDVRDLVRGELTGQPVLIGPERLHRGDPRPWEKRLEPIDG